MGKTSLSKTVTIYTPKINILNPKVEVWFRWFFRFQPLIFRGVPNIPNSKDHVCPLLGIWGGDDEGADRVYGTDPGMLRKTWQQGCRFGPESSGQTLVSPIFRSGLVPSVADCFRKCLEDKSATLYKYPNATLLRKKSPGIRWMRFLRLTLASMLPFGEISSYFTWDFLKAIWLRQWHSMIP